MKQKLDWKLIASDVTAALTLVSMIPYDKDSMDIINKLVPPTWIPWIIKAGIASTLILRFSSRYFTPAVTQPTETVTQEKTVQPENKTP